MADSANPHSITRRQFVAGATAAAGIAGTAVFTRGAALRHGAANDSAVRKSTGRSTLQPFPLGQVHLTGGRLADIEARNRTYMLSMAPDRLLRNFRVNAGLPSSTEPLGGWERPDCELRGHFVGHYLSASAQMAAAGNDQFLERGNRLVAALAECQQHLGGGYLSAFPTSYFDRLRQTGKVWAPFYTLHKILAGHIDMYQLTGNAQALSVAEGMAGWIRAWTDGLTDSEMQRIMQVEFGGTMESLFNLYGITGDRRYSETAYRFYHRAFFDPLAAGDDRLKGLHANTNIPKVIAAARGYELTGDPRLHDIASYFWREVTNTRTYCTGGTSDHEFWRTAPNQLSHELSSSNTECCCSYNMMKLTRHVHAWYGDPRAMDYYERVLWNSRVGTQNPHDGTLMYYLPLAAGYWKYYGLPLGAFWCCTGTGIEEYSKLADTIYWHDDGEISASGDKTAGHARAADHGPADQPAGLYVNLFIPSELHWPEKGLRLAQATAFPEEQATTLQFRLERPLPLTLHLRIPAWIADGGAIELNGARLSEFSSPGSYLSIRRVWHDGDRVRMLLPMKLHIAPMPDDPSVLAAMYGPLVLAGRLGGDGLTPALTWGPEPGLPKGPRAEVSPLKVRALESADWIERIEPDRETAPNAGSSTGLRFRTVEQPQSVELRPLNEIFDERYVVYWNAVES
jgi:DUF1680 family protein